MKIDDILTLARKTKSGETETRQEDRIFIPKLNVRMVDSIMRHVSQPRTFNKKEIVTIMDLQRLSPKFKKGKVDPDTIAKAREMKTHFEASQALLHKASDTESIQELLRAVVINRIEKDLDEYKQMPTLKERQKHLESSINEYCSNFETFRKIFSNPKHDAYVDQSLMTLVSKESLEDIEKHKIKRESLDTNKKEAVFKTYEALRNDISSREMMLEACSSLDKLIQETRAKISKYTSEKIECSSRIKDFQQELVNESKQVRHEIYERCRS